MMLDSSDRISKFWTGVVVFVAFAYSALLLFGGYFL